MKKLLYIEQFLPQKLYNQFSSLAPVLKYHDTNPAKRSFCSEDLKILSPFLYESFIDYVNEALNVEIIDSRLFFYKRNNTIFNPHVDRCQLNLLIYLQGEKVDMDNGTFFMNDEKMALRSANIANSAILFDSKIKHGSIQALYKDEEKTGWRYSLNCFINSYKSSGWI
jgi:hypothetical protein